MIEGRTLLVQLQQPDASWVDVGYLHHSENRNWFEFADQYWNLAARPVVGQVFEEHGRHWRPTAHVALPRWFGHLLPEGRVREIVARAATSSGRDEYKLLARLGADDLPGAIRTLDLDSHPLGVAPKVSDGGDIESEDPILKFSLAGVQLKFSVFGDEKALTVPAKGKAGNVILKFPDSRPGFSGVPESELGSLKLAEKSGIASASGFLVRPETVSGLGEYSAGVRSRALAVHRFDRRPDDKRVHMEELAQILDISTAKVDAKYRSANFETVAVVMAALAGTAVVGEVIDRIVLNVLIGNGDAHLKNWAVLYPNGRTPTLAPAYDLVPTILYLPGDNLGMNLGGTKNFSDVTVRSFDRIGARTGYGVRNSRQRAGDAVERIMENFSIMEDYVTGEAMSRLKRYQQGLGIFA
ncbi:type II toxin-antitoxin system HipA family toxin [Nocardia africana]|uniref:Type II toxin-antitoxin system HipA family toxin n=1 Tax=Nocardia africana TaxID=134964 RepID=A0ABW6NLH3_9NOCA